MAPTAGLLHLDAWRLASRVGDARAAEIYENNAHILLGDSFAAMKVAVSGKPPGSAPGG